MIKKIIQIIKNIKQDITRYSLDNPSSKIYLLLEKWFLSDFFAALVSGIFRIFNGVYVKAKYYYDSKSDKFYYRSIFVIIAYFIIGLISIFIGISAISGINSNIIKFLPSETHYGATRLVFQFDPNSLKNKYSTEGNVSYSDYASKVTATIKTQLTELFANGLKDNNNPTAPTYSISDLSFSTLKHNRIAIQGSSDEIGYVYNLEKAYLNPDMSGAKISLSDEYGRPLFFGEKYDFGLQNQDSSAPGAQGGRFDPSEEANQTQVIDTTGKDGFDTSLNGKTLYEICGQGKWWGKVVQGQLFSGASVADSGNKKNSFSTITFTLDSAGFFTSFTQYVYIMEAVYAYNYEKCGPNNINTSPDTTYVNNSQSGSNQYYSNQFLLAKLLFCHVLIWVNQEQMFKTSISIDSATGKSSYSFHWNTATDIGKHLKTEADIYEDKLFLNKEYTKNYIDESNLYFFYPKIHTKYYPTTSVDKDFVQYDNTGITSDSDDLINFLDFGFDHVKEFNKDPNSKDIPKPDGWLNDNPLPYPTQEWGQCTQLPYKAAGDPNGNIDPIENSGSLTNSNYNVLHYFDIDNDKPTPPDPKKHPDHYNYFSIAYGESNYKVFTYKAKNKTLEDRPYLYKFIPSIYGAPNVKLQYSIDDQKKYAIEQEKYCGLINVTSISNSSSNSKGLSAFANTNPISSIKGFSKENYDYYDTSNWAEFIPTTTKPENTKIPVNQQNNHSISSFSSTLISLSLGSDFYMSGSITYSPYPAPAEVLRILLIMMFVVLTALLILYLILKYRMLSFIYFLVFVFFVFFFLLIIFHHGIIFDPSNIMVIVFGMFELLVAINLLIKKFKEQYLAFKNRTNNKKLYSKNQFMNFFNIFFPIIMAGLIIALITKTDIISQAGIVISILSIEIFILVIIFLRYIILTILMYKKYDKIDKYLLDFNNEKKYNSNDWAIKRNGLILDITDRDNFRKRILEELSFKNWFSTDKIKNKKLKQLIYSEKKVELKTEKEVSDPKKITHEAKLVDNKEVIKPKKNLDNK